MQVIRLATFVFLVFILSNLAYAQASEVVSDTVGLVPQENPAVESAEKKQEAPLNEVSPPAEQSAKSPETSAATPAPIAVSAPAPKDPCEAYMSNISAYNVCHDRLNKIERMKKARERRESKPEEPAKATPATQETVVPKDTAPVESKPADSETTRESPKK
jgi:hypothetical protein